MKKLLIFIFSIIFSSSSFAGWNQIGDDVSGNNYYINYSKVKKIDGYHYYRWMVDMVKPDNDGDLSYISYTQGDCKFSRYMTLSEYYYPQAMGEGSVETNQIQNPEWRYPAPESMNEYILELACEHVK